MPGPIPNHPPAVPMDCAQHVGVVRAHRTDPDDLLLGERGVIEQHAHDIGMWVAHDSLDQVPVVRSRERLSLTERQRPTTAEVGYTSRRVFPFLRRLREQKIRQVVPRLMPGFDSQLDSTLRKPGLEEGPAERKKYFLTIGVAARRGMVGFVDEGDAAIERKGFELFAEESHPHRDFVDAREPSY